VDDHVQVGSFDDGGLVGFEGSRAKHDGRRITRPPRPLPSTAPPDTSRHDGKDTVRLAPKTDAQVTSDKSADRVLTLTMSEPVQLAPPLVPSLQAGAHTRSDPSPRLSSLSPSVLAITPPLRLLDEVPDTP
jgi:hypothetical protein